MNQSFSKTINVTGYLAFALSTIWSIYLVFFGLDLSDSFYFGCKFLYSGEVNVFLPFTQFIMNCSNWLFGDYMIAYRLVNWLFYYLTYIFVYLFVQSINTDFRKYGLWILSGALVLMTNINTNVFSGESIAAFFLICTFISLYKAIHNNHWWLIGFILSVALCILTQFPNVVLIPILLATSWLLCNKKTDYGYIVLSLLASFVLYLIINAILYGGLGAYWNTLINAFASAASLEGGADHSTSSLLSEYLHTLKDTMSDIKYLSIICIIPLIPFFMHRKYAIYFATTAFFLAQLAFVKMRVQIISDVYNYFLIVYFYAIILISIFSMVVIGVLRHNWKLIGFAIIPLGISLCSPAGSDSGLCLLGSTLFAFIPWTAFSYIQMIKSINRKEMVYLVFSLVALSVCAFVYVREGMMMYGIVLLVCILIALWWVPNIKWEKLKFEGKVNMSGNTCFAISYILLALVAVCFTLYAKNQNSFEWVSPKEFTCQHKFEQLKYIWTNPRSCQHVENVMNDYRTLATQGKTIVFFGHYSYVFSYLTHQREVPGTEFTQTDIPRNINALENYIRDKDIIVFLSPYNPASQVITVDEYPNTKLMLEQHGYSCEDKDNKYAIFYPSK